MEDKEIWKDVPLYEGVYKINILGEIRICKSNRIRSAHIDAQGYRAIGLSKNGSQRTFKIHRILATVFIPNPNNLPTVNHKDGVKTNNSIDNLEWCSYQDNCRHAIVNGLTKFQLKLNQSCLIAIRNLYNSGLTYNQIAEIFEVSKRVISKANNTKQYIERPDREAKLTNVWKPAPVHTIDDFGNPVEYFSSINDAARKLGINDSYIVSMLNGRQKTVKGYRFCRTELKETA